jgi:broad specificity phosphatase PhoE
MRPFTPAVRGLAALLLLPLSAACASTASGEVEWAPASGATTEPTTIYVVRHAERASEEDRDSPLSDAGRARAEALANALEASGIETIYVTQYRRTRETVAPLAGRLGLTIRTDTTTGGTDPARDLARRVLAAHPGGAVLIAGHSNTVPAIVHALGGPELPELASTRYGDLFILTIAPDRPVRTVRVQFGGAGDPRHELQPGH